MTAVFREAQGGVGPEFAYFEGNSGYIACPNSNNVPPAIVESWQRADQNEPQFHSAAATTRADHPTPIGMQELRRWTEPHDGVLYRFSELTLIFASCDFWWSQTASTKCAPSTVAASAAATAEQSR